jgi:microcompartment protein CcmK/EutM
VLVVLEGRRLARRSGGRPPVDAAVVGIVDTISLYE